MFYNFYGYTAILFLYWFILKRENLLDKHDILGKEFWLNPEKMSF